MKKIILIFGNPLLEFDSLPIRIKPQLEKQFPDIVFHEMDPNENLKPISKELIIIDTAINTDKIRVLTDIDKIELPSLYSPHDLDLGFNLKLLKKIGQLEKVTIFCLPPDMEEKKALNQLIPLIREYEKMKI